jgi:hypothetical protein
VKIGVESREGGPVESAGLCWTGLFQSEVESTGVHQTVLFKTDCSQQGHPIKLAETFIDIYFFNIYLYRPFVTFIYLHINIIIIIIITAKLNRKIQTRFFQEQEHQGQQHINKYKID